MKAIKHKASCKTQQEKQGFTLIEVILVLGIAGLMLVGLIGGTFTSIARQRYNDTVNNFVDFLETAYSEVISPKTLGIGNSKETVILGKVLVFGHDYSDAVKNRSVFSATLVADTKNYPNSSVGFMKELMSFGEDGTNARLYCGTDASPSTVQEYTPLWEAELKQANNIPNGSKYDDPFKGTLIIARTPSSNAVHTIFAKGKTYNLQEECTPTNHNVNTQLKNDFEKQFKGEETFYNIDQATGICIKSDNSAVAREVRLAADGRNTSAIWLRNVDDFEGDENRCQK